ncbi:MAG: Energy-dependent translational throttle protein EttA [Candidatus Ordinivivax streblomastigis]|uniref:Energy-dependent translational throttle protein EttA n=1 Tax=Candidatus Ordinivivax streblomastigis TaxID=2540710 RepID=A0A5M8P1U7_9BACT|nr:MAG: Energy-dependent translational throttle protein EttA [Candidatus Ordinivivax streblomastigis]
MTPYLQVDNLTKSFGDLLLFADISFGIAEGQRIGLIAKNGTGKTTLLNILTGKEDYDAGEITFRNDLRTGYLDQNPAFPPDQTVRQTCEGSENELLATQILTRFKITNLDQKIGELSGGQLKRVALAHVLMTEPDLLILDEPTNHLDLGMVEWVEDYLSRGNRTLLMVTHDRYFLDRVCSEIIEIENKQLYSYKGNYNYYLEKRHERLETQNAELDRANNLFRKELEWMRRQPQARGTKAKSRIDSFYELEKKVQQDRTQGNVKLGVKSSYIGNKIFEAQHLYKSFGALKIVEDFNYIFARYEKMGIIGDNGTGKSTFIKMLIGAEQPDQGGFDVGETVRFGYYSQEGLQFDDSMKVIDVVRNIAEVIDLGGGKRLTASQFLQHFLFQPEKQHDFVHKLSGGERRRLYLCTVLIQNPNFLVLDEPTNDLDIVTLNILEEYLTEFKGCVIVVSHDRYFMDKVVDHLLVFKGQGEIKDFPGDYTQYRATKASQDEAVRRKSQLTSQSKATNADGRKQDFAPNTPSVKLTFNEKRELEALDKAIPALEAEKAQVEEELSSGNLSNTALLEKSQRISQIINELDEKEMRWLELSEKV